MVKSGVNVLQGSVFLSTGIHKNLDSFHYYSNDIAIYISRQMLSEVKEY